MSNATVTPTMRALGWNVEFLATRRDLVFAGTYQPNHNAFMTFRDILQELRLCFDLQNINIGDGFTTSGAWNDIAFGLAGLIDITESDPELGSIPTFIDISNLDVAVPALPENSHSSPEERPLAQYHVLHHNECSLPINQPYASHIQAGCARHIAKPTRRTDLRYLPPKKAASDPRITTYPLRRTRGRKGSQSPTKRTASGSVSPSKDLGTGQDVYDEADDLPSIIAPQSDMSPERARQIISSFRPSCLVSSRQCAITGKGRSWCANPSIGPTLEACHIIPQQHYYLYPDPEDLEWQDPSQDARQSSRRLYEAWERTWSPGNGILLLSHIHSLFDARLLSIHPQTLRIRVFVPFDVITEYHGRIAKVPRSVDRAALRHHYDMCCIENMAANMPWVEHTPLSSSMPTSGAQSPFVIRSTLANAPFGQDKGSQSQLQGINQSGNNHGDPSKRVRATDAASNGRHGQQYPELVNDDGQSPFTNGGSPESFREQTWLATESLGLGSHTTYHQTSEPLASYPFDAANQGNGKRSFSRRGSYSPSISTRPEGYITPLNSSAFLADVNWELIKVARRRIT